MEMAKYLAEAGDVEVILDIPNEMESVAFNPMDNSSLDSTKIESLGWKGLFTAEEGLRHTVEILREIVQK